MGTGCPHREKSARRGLPRDRRPHPPDMKHDPEWMRSARLPGQEQRNGLVDPLGPCFGTFRAVDVVDMEPLHAVRQSVEERRTASPAPANAAAKSSGTSTSRGDESAASVTVTASPATTPAASRTAALTGIIEVPPMTPIVVRYSCPFSVTRTAGRRPAPSESRTSGGTAIPVACLPSARESVA